MEKPKRKRFSPILIAAVVIVLGLILLFPIIGPRYIMPLVMGPPPAELDTAATRLTVNGLYRVSFVSQTDPIAINEIHSWTLHVETADGRPVDNGDIRVDGGMPQHGHGLPTQPQVTQNLGNGDYLVEGLKFQMPGWWEVKFDITAESQTDTITFNLVLP
jgi:hypothetical protein